MTLPSPGRCWPCPWRRSSSVRPSSSTATWFDLKEESPRLIARGGGLIERLRTWGRGRLPAWPTRSVAAGGSSRDQDDRPPQGPRVRSGQYRRRFPGRGPGRRLRLGSPYWRLVVFPSGSGAALRRSRPTICSHPRIDQPRYGLGPQSQVLSSLVMALPFVAILGAFAVSFPGMWGVLTFAGNSSPTSEPGRPGLPVCGLTRAGASRRPLRSWCCSAGSS